MIGSSTPDDSTHRVRLCCGQPVEDLWDHLGGPDPRDAGAPNPHAQQCPHCQDALVGMRALAWATSLLRAQAEPSPASLLTGVADVLRSIVERGRPPA